MTDVEADETSLTIRRTFEAARERVWQAFTDPEELAAWYAPGDMNAEVHDWEPEAGGAFSVSMRDDDGSHDAEGTFAEVVENEKLVQTWTWTHLDEPVETVVTVEFNDFGGGTEVVLTHEDHPDAETVEQHVDGWSGILANLEEVLREA